MDKITLDRMLQNSDHRQFWIKPIGDPDKVSNELSIFASDPIRIDFAKQPKGVECGDILLVYRIGISKFVYVAECISAPKQATSAEIEYEPWRERWCWSVTGHNLTPDYGTQWARHSLKPFELSKQYNELHPSSPQRLGALQFSSDKLRVSHHFAEFVIRKIIVLK